MIIKFEDIKIHNFLSIGDANIELKDKGYTLISGINNNPNDNAKSNGSGKSSIAEAILWVITGETFRGVKDVVNIYSEGGTSVEINFKLDNKDYNITRYKSHKEYGNNLKIIVDGKNISGKGIRDGEVILKQLLPDISAQLIGSVIILGQGLPQRFSNNTPSGRKEILEKLSKSDFMIEDIKSRLGSRKVSLSNQLRTAEDNILKLEVQKESSEKNIEHYKELLENLPSFNSLDEEINNIDKEFQEIDDQLLKELSYVQEFNDKLKSIEEEVETNLKNKEEALHNVDIKYHNDMNALIDQKYSLKSFISSLESEISKLESITDICPTCGQKLPGVIKPDTATQRNKLEELRIKLNSVDNQLNDLQFKLSQESKTVKESFDNQLTTLNNQKRDIKEMIDKSKVDEFEKSKTELRLRKREIELKKENYLNQKSQYNQVIDDNTTKLSRISQDLLYNNNERDLINEKLSVINKMFTIVTRDFRGFLLTNVINFIDKKIKEYSSEVFGNDKIEFILDGNNIKVNYDERQLENLSGGERQKVDIIIQLALRDMLVQYLNFNTNLLFIDEIFDNLDSCGSDKILNLISNKSNNIESLFIITHHSLELSIPYDNEIIIEKNSNGISYIK